MSHNPIEHIRHPEELLPWLVNGTLVGEERDSVEQHVQSCTHCQQEIALLQQMRTQVKETPTQSPGIAGLNRLLTEIRQEQASAGVRPQTQQPGWWRTGLAIAASLIICIQAGLLLDAWYLSKPMVPLAGPQAHEQVLQISFNPTATEAQIREVLTHVHATFIDGPSSLGIYRIALGETQTGQSSIDNTILHLRQQTGIIHHVAPE